MDRADDEGPAGMEILRAGVARREMCASDAAGALSSGGREEEKDAGEGMYDVVPPLPSGEGEAVAD